MISYWGLLCWLFVFSLAGVNFEGALEVIGLAESQGIHNIAVVGILRAFSLEFE